MRLSIQIEGAQGLTWPLWQQFVHDVETLGFAGLYCCDHFANPAPPDYDSLEVMTALTYAASHTTRIDLGPLVSPITWREPVMFARQSMSIDDLSGGRFILGVGAGWNVREHAMFGYPLGEPATRIARFTEALEVITRLVRGEGPQTFAGSFYQITDATLRPRPAKHTRIMIGGSGPKRTMPLVAKYADIWNMGGKTPEDVRERNTHLDSLLETQGRKPGDVRRTMMKAVICGRDDAEYERRIRGLRRAERFATADLATVLDYARTEQRSIVGTPEEVAAQIRAYGDAGIDEIMAPFIVMDDFEGVRVLAEEVLPLLG